MFMVRYYIFSKKTFLQLFINLRYPGLTIRTLKKIRASISPAIHDEAGAVNNSGNYNYNGYGFYQLLKISIQLFNIALIMEIITFRTNPSL